jgi:hypothetical protein
MMHRISRVILGLLFLACASGGCVSVHHQQFDGTIVWRDGTRTYCEKRPINMYASHALFRAFHVYGIGTFVLQLGKPDPSAGAHPSSLPAVSEVYFVNDIAAASQPLAFDPLLDVNKDHWQQLDNSGASQHVTIKQWDIDDHYSISLAVSSANSDIATCNGTLVSTSQLEFRPVEFFAQFFYPWGLHAID